MKNIVIDIGNTKTKYAVFSDGEIIFDNVVQDLSVELLVNIVKRFEYIDGIIFSAVGRVDMDIVLKSENLVRRVILADYNTPIPCLNFYKTQKTLGFDRIAACIGAATIEPFSDILVIDAGTAITYDIFTSKQEYLGGLISPGINMRYRALAEFTAKLPLCSIEKETPLIGTSTNESIIGGVQNGVVSEVDAYIDKIVTKYPSLKVFLTGGDTIFFDKKLKNSIFVNQKLIFYGLNRILEYNADK